MPNLARLHEEPFRALQVFDHVPAGCKGFLVPDDDFAPHLKRGEFAVVDVADKERQYGELYVITIGYDERAFPDIVQLIKGFATGGKPCTVGIWYAFSLGRNVLLGDGRRCRSVDGPLGFQHWPEKCVGRIVGLIKGHHDA